MICQTCEKKDATIHYFESVNGESRTMNLCEDCAVDADLGDVHLNVQIQGSVEPPSLTKASYDGLVAKPQGILTCVGCGLELQNFLASRQYQCPGCRDTFRHALGGDVRAASEAAELKAQLDEAVASEDYERAAVIRDKLEEAGHV
jgi:protein arginine kinase activator